MPFHTTLDRPGLPATILLKSSAAGYLGDTAGHCKNGGISALDECCTRDAALGTIDCQVQCDDAPVSCTGVAAIDAVLEKSNVGCKIGLSMSNKLYTMQGLCDAITEFNKIPGTTRRLYLGDTSSRGAARGLSNIAALLAQAMWESGGEAPFTACDENNYKHSPTAACTQRSDGSHP